MKPSELLNSPDKWCKKAGVRTKQGEPCDENDSDAYSYCLLIALVKCKATPNQVALLDSIIQEKKEGAAGIVTFNDAQTTTYETLLAVLKEAGL